MTQELSEEAALQEALDRYGKIKQFEELIIDKLRGNMKQGGRAYPPALAEEVVGAISSVFDLPSDQLLPLRELIESGADLTALVRGEAVPELPYGEEETRMLLFIAARPLFLFLSEADQRGGRWEGGICPVCGSAPSIAGLEEGKRVLCCPCCGSQGEYQRIGCPVCLSGDPAHLGILTVEGDSRFRIDTCDACGTYIKTVRPGLLDELTPPVADILSLPLDIIAQEKGYRRVAPNPLGMVRMK